jgi:hypothetical protein
MVARRRRESKPLARRNGSAPAATGGRKCGKAKSRCGGTAADISSKIAGMSSLDQEADGFWRKVAALLGLTRDKAPIDSVAALTQFLASRAAYVAQKTLYGYVKTRMGTRYVAMFADEKIAASITIAKLNVFAACLSDLTVYAAAAVLPAGDAGRALAQHCYAQALRAQTEAAPSAFSTQDAIGDFARRLALTDWRGRARQPENFSESPRALVRWAPIAENLKKLDSEIVENSVKFSWRDIRDDFNKRLDAAAVAADWARQAG